MDNNEKKDELTPITENAEKEEILNNEETNKALEQETKPEDKTIEEKKEEFEIESKINNRSSNDLRPRKWLLWILVAITIAIVGILAYQTVFGIKSAFSSSNGSWGIFNPFRKTSKIEDEAKNIIDQAQNQINETQKEVTNQREKIAKDSFNSKFEQHIGSNYPTVVGWLLDDVILNNKKNKDYLITVAFKDKSTTNPEEIKNFKKQFIINHQYEVSIDYDNEGYVNKITIEE